MPTRTWSTPALRGTCPGCTRSDVIVLPPTQGGGRHLPKPWRRRAHAVWGDLAAIGAERCRYPLTLTPEEIPGDQP